MTILRFLERFLMLVLVFGTGFALFVIGNGGTLTALTVLPFDDVLLSTETFLDWDDVEVVAGRIVLELSSETFPVDNFGGDSFRGEEGVF
jgi:hypothetical protein